MISDGFLLQTPILRRRLLALGLGLSCWKPEVGYASEAPKPQAPSAPAEDTAAPASGTPATKQQQTEDNEQTADNEQSSAPSSAVAATPARPDRKKNYAFLAGRYLFETGSLQSESARGTDVVETQNDVSARGPALQFGALFGLNSFIRLGAAFNFSGNYTVRVKDPDAADDAEPDERLFGQRLGLELQTEFFVPIAPAVDIFAQPNAGIVMLIPGGDLQTQIDSSQLDPNQGPRFGWNLGIKAGARYFFHPSFALNCTFGYSWQSLYLLNTSLSSEFVDASDKLTLGTSRVEAALAVEAHF
ncbi:MAG: hypothetical protein MK135_09765 [Polyangiaceae bacterium]|nr:hypothetical protein [Polyangiaceae bacterium]